MVRFTFLLFLIEGSLCYHEFITESKNVVRSMSYGFLKTWLKGSVAPSYSLLNVIY